MTTATEQQAKATFRDAVRRPQRPEPQPVPEHGPLAGRRPDKSLFLLPLDRIRPDPAQVRTQNKTARDEEVRELAQSIKTLGLENPLTVRYLRDHDIYQLIAGERRFAAARLAGLTEVPVKLIDATESTIRRLQLHENIHRADLTPLELGNALVSLLDDGETPDSLAAMLCKSPAYVQKALTVVRHLTTQARELVDAHSGRFPSMDLLYEVAQAPEDRQVALLTQLKDNHLTRRELREIVAPLKEIAKTARGSTRGRKTRPRRSTHVFPVDDATVTVVFRKPTATRDEITRALRQALAGLQSGTLPETSYPG